MNGKIDRVYLCGLSGSGKSSVAPILAHLRGASVLDTDAMIVAEAGVSIAEIFEREGEEGFREREARAVAAAARQPNCIVALGGGALERDASLAQVIATGTLVFLDAEDATLERRVQGGGEVRPLLSQPGAFARMRAQRLARYRNAALTIDTSTLTPHEVASEIDRAL